MTLVHKWCSLGSSRPKNACFAVNRFHEIFFKWKRFFRFRWYIFTRVYVLYYLMELCILGRETTSIWRAWRTTQNECCRKIVDDFAHCRKHSRKDFDGLYWTNQEPPRGSTGQREIFEHNQKTYPSVSGLYGFQGRYSNTFYFRWQLISQIP